MSTKRIFFIHAEKFMAPVAAALRAQGTEIVAATTRGRGSLEAWTTALPGAPVLFSTQARSMLLPAELASRVRAARVTDIEALAPTAARTLQMIDRMNHYGYSVAELMQTYLHMIGFWRTMLDELRPDAVVFSAGPPSFGFDHVLYQLAKADGIEVIIFRHTHVEGHAMVTGDIFEVPGPSAAELDAAPSSPADPAQFASPTNDHMHRQAMNLREIRSKLSLPGVVRTLIGRRQLGLAEPNPELLYKVAPRHYEQRWLHFTGRLECRRALARYDAIARTPDLSVPFVYAPLAMEPEESTMPLGGHFADTMLTVRTMSQALPSGVRLYVKEHANTFNRKYLVSKGRNQHFYQRLQELPNVTMVPLESDSKQLIRAARAVVTIAGTSGWEALQVGTPALVFGWPWYLRAPGLEQVDGVEACKRALARIATGELRVDVERVRRFERVMRERYLTPVIYSTEFVAFEQMPLAAHFESYVGAVQRALGAPAAPPVALVRS